MSAAEEFERVSEVVFDVVRKRREIDSVRYVRARAAEAVQEAAAGGSSDTTLRIVAEGFQGLSSSIEVPARFHQTVLDILDAVIDDLRREVETGEALVKVVEP